MNESGKTPAKGRRDVLKFGLASVAGIAAGFSFLKGETSAHSDLAQAGVGVRRLMLQGGGATRTLAAASRNEALAKLAPVIDEIVKGTGDKLSPDQLLALKNEIMSKGTFRLPDPTTADGYTLTVTLGGIPSPNKMIR